MVAYADMQEYPLLIGLDPSEPIAIDTETLGATKETNLPIYFSWASKALPAGAGPTTTPEGWAFLEALCATPNPKVFHNAKFDLTVLEKVGIVVQGKIHDTILMHCLLDEHHLEHHRLKALSRELLNKPRLDEYALYRVQKKRGTNFNTPQEQLHPYAVEDAADTLALYYLFKPQLEKQGLWKLYRFEVAVEMIYKQLDATGVAFDADAVYAAIEEMQIPLDELATRIYTAFGEEFLISSGQQLGDVLAKHFPLTIKTAKSDQWSTAAEVLQPFLTDSRMQLIAGWKFLTSAKSKAKGYAKHVVDGRIHPDYRQTTKTGRCNCHAPNLTTIPKQRGRITSIEVGNAELAEVCGNAFRQVRKGFVAPPGTILIAFDYKQIEYRGFTHYSASKRLIECINAGEDFHTMTCRMIFGEVNARLRHIAKIINFGLLYGMGQAYLFKMLRAEGVDPRDILRRYEANLPEMRITQRKMENVVRSRGYIVDVFGRRYRYLEDWAYKVVSWICQGTAANIKKTAMLRTHKIWTGRSTKLVLDIHDDLTFQLYPQDVEQLIQVKQAMEDFPQFTVPIIVEASVGYNLLEMQKIKIDVDGLKLVKGMFNQAA